MMSLRVKVNVTCELFVKGFRVICLPLKTDLILAQTLTPRLLEIFFYLSQFWAGGPFFTTVQVQGREQI